MPLPAVGQVITVLPVAPATEKRQGICKFVGETQFAEGLWVGIELIGSQGKNNGSVNGVHYFVCEPGKGVFIRPELVEERSSETSFLDPEAAKKGEELRKQLEEVTKQLSTREEDFKKLTEAKESIELDLEIAREENLNMTEDLQSALEELMAFRAKQDPHGALKQELAEARDLCQKLQDENQALRSQLDLEAKSVEIIEKLTETKLELEARNTAVLRKLNKLQTDFDELQSLSALQDDELLEQRSELDAHQQEMDELLAAHKRELETKAVEYSILHRQLVQREQELTDLKSTSGDSHQELARDLRRLKDDALRSQLRIYWDDCMFGVSQLRITAASESLAETTTLFAQAADSFAQIEQLNAIEACTRIRGGLQSRQMKELGRTPYHIETSIALAVLQLRASCVPIFSLETGSNLKQINGLLEKQFHAAAREGSGVGAWSEFLGAALKCTSHLQKTVESSPAAKVSQISSVAGSQALATLRFLFDEAEDAFATVEKVLGNHDGNDEIASVLQRVREIHRSLREVETPLRGVEALFNELKPENMPWPAEATNIVLLALAEAHAVAMPIMTVATRCTEFADDASRGVAPTFWGAAASQLFQWFLGAPRPEDTIIRGWLPSTEHGLKLSQLAQNVGSGLKRLWSQLENVNPFPADAVVFPCLSLQAVLAKIKKGLREAIKVDDGVTSEKVAEAQQKAKEAEQKVSEMQSKLDRANYEASAQRTRCSELEVLTTQLRASESKAKSENDKLTKNYTAAFATMEKEASKLQEELTKQRRLTQEASSIAPLSQWERKQFKHSVEVYRQLAQQATLERYRALPPKNAGTTAKRSFAALQFSVPESVKILPLIEAA